VLNQTKEAISFGVSHSAKLIASAYKADTNLRCPLDPNRRQQAIGKNADVRRCGYSAARLEMCITG
jgi:hypothetical protein